MKKRTLKGVQRSAYCCTGRLFSRMHRVGEVLIEPQAGLPSTRCWNVHRLAEAKRCGATDCVFLNADGYATEASTSNLFALRGGKVVTPPLTAGLLAGTTRAALLDFCRNRDQETLEIDLRAEDLESAEELWLTSSLRDVAPVTHLNGRELHGGGPGPFAAALAKDFTKWADARARDTDGPAARECAQGL